MRDNEATRAIRMPRHQYRVLYPAARPAITKTLAQRASTSDLRCASHKASTETTLTASSSHSPGL
jgi:hypothetical protein